MRDAGQGGVLAGLLAVLAEQADVVDQDVARLYDDWFIETCQEWVVPYIGDLLRVRGTFAVVPGTSSQRAYVANTLGYRRRKGTVAVLERVAYDVTGWRARAVEFYRLLAATQHVNHPRLATLRTPDLRDTASLELLGGPFEQAAHSAEVRGAGRYDIPNVGLFLWRLQAYQVTGGEARAVASPADGRYTFSPLGDDRPLFNPPRTEAALDHLAQEVDVPGRLRRRPLHDELDGLRQGSPARAVWFPPGREVLRVATAASVGAAAQPIPPERVFVCDLSQWRRPAAEVQPVVAVDPVLGRLAFPAGTVPGVVRVGFAYGFAGDLGGGPYERRLADEPWLRGTVTWQHGVVQDDATRGAASDPTLLSATLGDAVAAWNAHVATHPTAFGVIAVMDSGTYTESLTGAGAPVLPAGCRLGIVAAGWPEVPVPGQPGVRRRIAGELAPDLLRPHLRGDLEATGTAAAGAAAGSLAIDGLLVEGRVTVRPGRLGALTVAHSTLVPASGGLTVAATAAGPNDELAVSLVSSVCGPLTLAAGVPTLAVSSSVVDGTGTGAISAPGADATLTACTVLGASSVRSVTASDCIFTGPATARRLQAGCVRFSSVADGSALPRRFRCQPELGLTGVTDPVRQASIRARLDPQFTSVAYGDPGYAQLASSCAGEILTGASDGSEMGVFAFLHQPQRLANLRQALDEYLRFGLEAGTYFVT